MKVRNSHIALVFAGLLGVTAANPIDARGSGRPTQRSAANAPVQPGQELQDLLRRSQELADQANAALKRTLEQNESLQRMLEETRRELVELREEVGQLRSTVSAHHPGEPRENTGVGATRVHGTAKAEAAGDDLAGRLTRLEDQVDVNTVQIKEQAQTKIESDSKFGVRMFGTVLFNSFFNSADIAERAVPVVAPPTSVRVPNGGGNFGATLRQTTLGFAMNGPRLGGAKLSADVDFDFYGETASDSYGSGALGALRMRTATARLDGKKTSLAVGLMAPMVSPLNPVSMAAVYYSPLGDSGNLWQWQPQVVAERRFEAGESTTVALQGGLSLPSGENFYGKWIAGKPGYETRMALRRRIDDDRRLEVGIGAYLHPQEFGFDRTVDSYAVAGDWVLPLSRRLVLSGEAFYGQSVTLRAETGSDISPFFSFTGGIDDPRSVFRGIRAVGGWVQLHAQATPKLEFNGAFGMEDPRNRDVFAGLYRNTTRLRNQTTSVNSIYRFRSNFLLSLEYRYLATAYADAARHNNHVNVAVGYAF